MNKPTFSSTAPASPAQRRHFLRSGAAMAGALGLAGPAHLLLATPAQAQAGDYKALVCIFLYGGNDGLNTILPSDLARHNQYAGVRRGLAIPRSSLVPLTGTQYGLHPALSALSTAWNAGHMAPVFNVGPLYQPLTKAQYRAAASSSVLRPEGLFSHSDQQVLWESGTTHSHERTGWGGRASAAMGTTNPVISVGGSARFGLSQSQAPLVLPEPGATFGAHGLQPEDLRWAPQAGVKTAVDVLYAQPQDTVLADAYTRAQRDAFAMSQRLAAIVKVQPGGTGASSAIDSAFAPLIASGRVSTGLGRQLYQVAKLIAGNTTVQGNRQVFFAQLGGFDTHGDQITAGSPTEGQHARLLKQLGDAVAAFHAAMNNLGLGRAVTTFTQSDFGRTFAPNNSGGTDHAWGNHHLVVGGAVRGGTSYGHHPELVLGGADDVGVDSWEQHGRWLPTTSVDQYAATLLKWFGASEGQLDTALPNLRNFGAARTLGFV